MRYLGLLQSTFILNLYLDADTALFVSDRKLYLIPSEITWQNGGCSATVAVAQRLWATQYLAVLYTYDTFRRIPDVAPPVCYEGYFPACVRHSLFSPPRLLFARSCFSVFAYPICPAANVTRPEVFSGLFFRVVLKNSPELPHHQCHQASGLPKAICSRWNTQSENISGKQQGNRRSDPTGGGGLGSRFTIRSIRMIDCTNSAYLLMQES